MNYLWERPGEGVLVCCSQIEPVPRGLGGPGGVDIQVVQAACTALVAPRGTMKLKVRKHYIRVSTFVGDDAYLRGGSKVVPRMLPGWSTASD